MENSTSIKGLFQGMVPTSATLKMGEVISISPLTIRDINDEKLELSDTLRIPNHLTKHECICDISGGTVSAGVSGGDHSHTISSFSVSGATITIDNSLKVGDIVYMLAVADSKIYYVFDKGA